MLLKPITEKEVKEVIVQLKNNKSPGLDRFAREYYRDLTPILCKLYNYVLNSGTPPQSWSDAVITVLHNKGKDPLLCSSYIP